MANSRNWPSVIDPMVTDVTYYKCFYIERGWKEPILEKVNDKKKCVVSRETARSAFLLIFCLLCGNKAALAGGFAIPEQSASAAGAAVAGAGAIAQDPGTVFYNPAGMTRLDGDHVSLVGQAFVPRNRFDNDGTTDGAGNIISGTDDLEREVIPLGSLFAVVSLSDRLKLGLGVTSPFGLASEYEDDWVGRYNTLLSGIATVDINPSVAFRVTDWLSLGAGVSAQYAYGERRNDLDFGSICFNQLLGAAACTGLGILPQGADGRLEIEAEDWSFGYNFGAMIEPRPGTRLAIAYRSQIHHSFEGDADYTVPAVAAPLTQGGALFQDTAATTEITFPATLSLGLYHELSPRLALMTDVTWTGWHSFETLRIDLANPLQPDIVQEEDWRDTFRYALGLHYAPADEWLLRAGIAYDETPVQDGLRNPGIPGHDRLILGLGAGHRLSDAITLDVAYVYAREQGASVNQFRPASGTVRGEYHNSIHILSGQLTWRF